MMVLKDSRGDQDIMAKKVLVAYYSWSGTTKRLAQQINSQVPGSTIFEIKVPDNTFSNDMNKTSDISKRQLANNDLPEVVEQVEKLNDYDLVLVGGPVWSGAISTPVMSFLNDIQGFSGQVAPVYTDAGSYDGYEASFKKSAGKLDVIKGFEGHQDLNAWLEQVTR